MIERVANERRSWETRWPRWVLPPLLLWCICELGDSPFLDKLQEAEGGYTFRHQRGLNHSDCLQLWVCSGATESCNQRELPQVVSTCLFSVPLTPTGLMLLRRWRARCPTQATITIPPKPSSLQRLFTPQGPQTEYV